MRNIIIILRVQTDYCFGQNPQTDEDWKFDDPHISCPLHWGGENVIRRKCATNDAFRSAINKCRQYSFLLADRTNGRAIGTVLRLSVCLWRYVLWLNGASQSKS